MKERATIGMRKIAGEAKSLYLDYRINGKRFRENLKLYIVPEKTQTQKVQNNETRRIANEIKARKIFQLEQAEAGIVAKKTQSNIFLEQYYIQLHERDASVARHGYSAMLSHIRQYFNGLSLPQVDAQAIENFVHQLKQNGLKRNSISLYASKIKAILYQAKSDGIIDNVPSTKGVIPTIKNGVRTFLTIDELRKLDPYAKDRPFLRAFMFSCFTGLRLSDVKAFRKSQIVNDTIMLQMRKTSEVVAVPISQNAKRYLPEQDSFKLECSSDLRRDLTNICQKVGIDKKVSFHVARHTFATNAYIFGADIYTISKLLGHSSVKTTQIYAKVGDKEKKKAVDAIPPI